MKKVLLTKGLPASGKSTWAKQYQIDNPNSVRVNKDDLRAMLHNGVWSRGREDFILKVRNFIIEQALKEGHDVIVDDTNLSPKHEATIRQIVKGLAEVEIKDFTDVDIETCIERDLKRPNSVGEKVIRQMYRQFLKPNVPTYHPGKNLPEAIICDVDGTLALFGNANPYNRDFSKDMLNKPVADIINRFGISGVPIILFSGRNGKYQDETEKWLEKNGVTFTQFHMREEGDTRKDFIVKKEMFEKYIKGKFNIMFVLDDRNQVVELWRSLGLTCLQVADGDF